MARKRWLTIRVILPGSGDVSAVRWSRLYPGHELRILGHRLVVKAEYDPADLGACPCCGRPMERWKRAGVRCPWGCWYEPE